MLPAYLARAGDAFGPILVIGVIALVIVIFVLSWIQAAKRRKALIDLAHRMGLTFAANDYVGVLTRYGNTNFCARGHAHKVSNIIFGRFRDGDVCAFDYQYTTGSGKNQADAPDGRGGVPRAVFPLRDARAAGEHLRQGGRARRLRRHRPRLRGVQQALST